MSQSNYTLQCIERAVLFMSDETRLGHTPALEAIAKAAGLSKYHFNRVYRLATGETPQETLTRFKLARATESLKNPDTSVTEAAFAAGYGSSQSFAKALKRVLAASATTIRADQERLSDAVETLIVPQTAAGLECSDLSVEIAQIEPFQAVALRTDGTYPSLNVIYETLFEAIGDPSIVQAILGRPYGDIGLANQSSLRFDCALKLTKDLDHLTGDIVRSDVHGGVYLLTRHVGSYDQLPDAVDRLYLTALSQDGIQIAEDPLLFHYLDDPETTETKALRTDLYLPLVV
ncbi:MAG: AraC family transcriptional regulator [Henriciella sp.]